MTTALYALGKAAISNGGVALVAGDIRAIPVTATYTPNFTTHANLEDVTLGGRAILAADAPILATKVLTVAAGKVNYDADDVTFPGVGAGDPIVGIVLFLNTGDESTSTLIGFFDYFANLPITPDGRDIIFTWPNDANRVFSW